MLRWGRPEVLVLPRADEVGRVAPGDYVLVKVYRDAEHRPVASMRLNDFVTDEATGLRAGDEVSLRIADPTDLGVKAVVNDRFWGLIYASDLYRPLRKGLKIAGYVRNVREDHRLDLALTPPGYAAVDPLTDQIVARLREAGGYLAFTDKSEPEAIYRAFGVSKKQFKQAIGALYKQRRIALEERGLRLRTP